VEDFGVINGRTFEACVQASKEVANETDERFAVVQAAERSLHREVWNLLALTIRH
jgi:hypothetical protein